MIKSYMSNYDPEEHLYNSFSFSSASTPNMIQVALITSADSQIGIDVSI